MRLQQLARDLWPYLQKYIEPMVHGSGSGSSTTVGGGAPSPHGLSSSHHTGTLADNQAPQFLMRDGSRSLLGNLPVAAGITIDGVDLSAHVANPSAHHAPATAGNTGISVSGQAISLALAATSGLQISSGLKVGAGDGIDVLANTIAVDVTDIIDTTRGIEESSNNIRVKRATTSGLGFDGSGGLLVGAGDGIDVLTSAIAVDVTDIIDTAYGLTENSNDIRINKATDSGLAFNGSGQLTLGTPSSISVSSVNSLAGMGVSHSHAADASSDVSAGVAKLLKSTGAGGLGLASLFTTGAVDVGQGFTAGNNTIRMIYHTHDYPHTHMVVNPTGLWNLDEQFGLDIDDNLLVRGWIVGKHAIQVEGATMLVHFDGPPPLATNWVGTVTGHMGQVGTIDGTLAWAEGKFGGKCIGVTNSGTNLIRNPIFASALSNGWLGTASQASDKSFIGLSSAYYSGAGTQVLRTSGYNISLAAGEHVWMSAWVWCSEESMATISVRNASAANVQVGTTSTNKHSKQWELIGAHWQNDTGSTVNVRLFVDTTATGYLWVDACAAYIDSIGHVFASGEMPNGTYTGSASNSSTTLSVGLLRYLESGIVPTNRGSISLWYRLPWGMAMDAAPPATLIGLNNSNNFQLYKFSSSDTWAFMTNGTNQLSVGFDTAGAEDCDWHHVVLTWDVEEDESILYVDGTQVATGGCDAFSDGILYVGHMGGNNVLNGYIDDLGIFDRVLDEDQVRAIYESNAPIFAETSTWQWRAGRNRIYADAEGLWGVGASGGTILGLYAGDDANPSATKSWGGRTLSEGDFLLGRYGAANGGWMLFDQDLFSSNPGLSFGYGDVEVIRFDSGGASLYGVLDIDSNGGIYQGSGSFASPDTGLKISNASGKGVIAGYSGGTVQWYGASDGKLYAGGGAVRLDQNGVAITADSGSAYPDEIGDITEVNSLSFLYNGSRIGGIGMLYSTGDTQNTLVIGANDNGSADDSAIFLVAENATNPDTYLYLWNLHDTGLIQMGASSRIELSAAVEINQLNTVAARPALSLQQEDDSEEFVEFVGDIGGPISTAALGSYYGKVRVSINGTFKWMPVYN